MATNSFESGERKLIPSVLIYPEKKQGQVRQWLMLHRNSGNPNDYHAGKWNGLGGKLEADESPLECAVRELAEETGLTLEPSCFTPLGTLQYPNFKAHKNEDWLVFVFKAEVPSGASAWPRGPEGELAWIPCTDVLKLNLWEGDHHFIPHVVDGRPFIGTFWYKGQLVDRVWIQELS